MLEQNAKQPSENKNWLKEFKGQILTEDLDSRNYTEEQETVASPESEALLALTNRIKALEEFLSPLSYEDPRKLFGGTD